MELIFGGLKDNPFSKAVVTEAIEVSLDQNRTYEILL